MPLVLAVALGFGLWLAALYVSTATSAASVPFLIQRRPVRHADHLSVQQSSRRPTTLLYALNPMVGVLELMRWMLLPGSDVPGLLLVVPLVESAGRCSSTGILYFGRAERDFADVI